MKNFLFIFGAGLALMGCEQKVDVVIVNGCDPSDCRELHVSKDLYDGDAATWQEAADNDWVIIRNNMEEDLYFNEVIYGEVDEDDSDLLVLEPGTHTVAHEPDYILVVSPDEITMPRGMSNVRRWELLCEDQFVGGYLGDEFMEALEDVLEDPAFELDSISL